MSSKGAYTHLLSGALAEYVNEQTERTPESQNEIQEELALLRASAAKTVEMFNIAAGKKDQKNMYVAGQMMKKELEAVAKMARTAATIQQASTDQMTRASVELIISSIIDIVFGALRGERNGLDIAAKIEREIKDRISLTVDRGTVLLPSDEVVKLMDSTVAREPDTIDAVQ